MMDPYKRALLDEGIDCAKRAEANRGRPVYIVWAHGIESYIITESMPLLSGTEWYTSDGVQHGGKI